MSEHTGARQILLEVKDLKKHFPIKRGMLSRTVGPSKSHSNIRLSAIADRLRLLVDYPLRS